MIREFRLTDLPRHLMTGGLASHDLAHPREALLTPEHRASLFELARQGLGSSARHHALAALEAGRIIAVAALRPRSGPRAWELAHLYTPPTEAAHCEALLERCGAWVGGRGAERLFLRVVAHTPLQETAYRSGFFPVHTDRVYERPGGTAAAESPSILHLRPLTPQDTYAIFRLYLAGVPPAVRSAYGVTVNQWCDAQETPLGTVEQYGWERDGQLLAWLRVVSHGESLTLEALLHPDVGSAAPQFLDAAINRLGDARSRPAWVVPDHQTALLDALEHAGWERTHTYTVTVKSVAKRAEQAAMAPARV